MFGDMMGKLNDMKKKGKYCGSCPTLHAMLKNAGRDI